MRKHARRLHRAPCAVRSLRSFRPAVIVSLLVAVTAAAGWAATPQPVTMAALPPGFVLDAAARAALEASAAATTSASSYPFLPAAPYPDLPGWPVGFLGGSSAPVAADIDPSYPGLEVAVGTLSSGTNLYLFHADGTPVPGWPVDIGFFVASSPSVADIDGDGSLDIVAGDFGSNAVWALRADGTPLPGWPIPVGANVRSTAALVDLDPAYPGLEVVIGVQDGTVQAWHADGTVVPGWPVHAGTFVERCSPAIGDVDGDGDLEVFVGSWDTGGIGSGGIYGFDQHGATLPGWPLFVTGTVSVIASPAIADLDGDGTKEVIFGTYETNGRMIVVRPNGTSLPGWPVTIPRGAASSSLVSSAPAIGDLDGDGTLEIVTGSCGNCGSMYAWHRNGTTVPGWPVFTNAVVDGSNPVLGDVDGDGGVDVVVGSGSGFTPFGCTIGEISKAYVFHADGSLAAGWPVDLGTASVANPALWDIDRDGDVDLVLSFTNIMYAWDAPGRAASPALQWPFFHFDVAHTGVYRPTPFTGVAAAGEAGPGPGGAAGTATWQLSAPYPNPIGGRGEARWRISLPSPAPVSMTVFDAAGRAMRAVDLGLLPAGSRDIAWDGADARGEASPPGVYFVRVRAGTVERFSRVALIR